MSWKLKCTAKDKCIENIKIYIYDPIATEYNIGFDEICEIEDIPDSTAVKFTATPVKGEEFDYWRCSASGKTSNVYENPFEYKEGQDLTLMAVHKDNAGNTASEPNLIFESIDTDYVVWHIEGIGGAYSYVEWILYKGMETHSSDNFSFTGKNKTPSKIIRDLSPDTTYTLGCYLYENSDSEKSTYISDYFTTESSSRPNNFDWTNSKEQGAPFNLTAEEWNNFTSRINAFRAYRGLSDYSFTYAETGDIFTANMYNQARSAIQDISGYGTYIPTVTSGQNITANMMNVLVFELNAIP